MELLERLLGSLPLHPMLVHFPIALFISALVLELAYQILKREFLHQAALTVYVLGVCSMPLTAWVGWLEAEELHLKHPVLDLHMRFALTALWISLASLPALWLIHQKSRRLFNAVFMAVLVLVVVFVSAAGYNGGRMVYEYGVGVQR
jgi:uncharacterized membrane protein